MTKQNFLLDAASLNLDLEIVTICEQNMQNVAWLPKTGCKISECLFQTLLGQVQNYLKKLLNCFNNIFGQLL